MTWRTMHYARSYHRRIRRRGHPLEFHHHTLQPHTHLPLHLGGHAHNARRVMSYHVCQETRVCNVKDDAAGNIWQAVP